MNNALWLFFALPRWYFESFQISQDSILTAIPSSGIAALVLGAIISFWGRRNLNLLWIMASIATSQAYVAIAGLFRGQMSAGSNDWPFFCMAFTQLVILAVLLWRSRGNRIAAAFLSWFGITYALVAAFIGRMAFIDAWL